MGPTRKRDLTIAVAGVAVVSYLLVGLLYRWFPPITMRTGISLLAVALAETGWGWYVRVKISNAEIGRGAGRLDPLVVGRTVLIAKASVWVGAPMLGFWVGVLGYVLPQRAVLVAAERDTVGAAVAAASALALLVAALWLQHCCKSPPESGELTPRVGNQPG